MESEQEMETGLANWKVHRYVKLFESIRKKVPSEQVALTLLQEVTKDLRMDRIRDERNASRYMDQDNGHGGGTVKGNGGFNGNGNGNGSKDWPATPNQVAYLKKLGVEVP